MSDDTQEFTPPWLYERPDLNRRRAMRRESDDRLAMALATARHCDHTAGIADLFNLDTAQRAEFESVLRFR